MKHLMESDYRVSTWSGGKTVQLSICPENADYADRTFLWRVSSATVELEESVFTPLPDYNRLIAPIRGYMELCHNGGEAVRLDPYSVHAFDGADRTDSKGKCTDFNLMLKKGSADGSMQALRLKPEEEMDLFPGTKPGARFGNLLLFAAEGNAVVRKGQEEVFLAAGESVLLSPDDFRGDGMAFPRLFAGAKGAVLMEAVIFLMEE